MPIIPPDPKTGKPIGSLPDSIDPKNASVFDPLYQTMIRKAVSILGLDDPAGGAMQLGSPVPLISIYKNKAARQAATALFRRLASDRFGPNTAAAFNAFADKYPRIAAHINPLPAPTLGYAAAMTKLPHGRVTAPMLLGTTPLGRSVAETGPYQGVAKNFIFHEGTHAAQALGNKDTWELYRLANRLYGYSDNPFEVSARNAAEAAQRGLRNSWSKAYGTVPNILKGHINPAVTNIPLGEAVNPDKMDAASNIMRILTERELRGQR